MKSARQDLNNLAARVFKDANPEEAVLLAWPLVCGTAVARRACAAEFQNGTLRVDVPDRGWQSQLEAFSLQYSQSLSKLTGISVERIVYQINQACSG